MARTHSLVLLVTLALTSLASSTAQAYSFVGYHASGAFYFQVVKAPVVAVCREDGTDIPAGWPEGLSNVGPGALCVDLPDQVGGKPALDYAKKETKGVRVDKKNAYGLDVKLEQKGPSSDVVVVNGDKKQTLATINPADGKPVKIDDTFWRADGRVVTVVMNGGQYLAHGNVEKILVGGPAGRKLAEKLHDDGMKLYKKRDWSAAGKLFEDAIAADPDWAPGRYARAAAEAQGGVGRTAMIENLQWLKEHQEKIPEAKKMLASVKGDTAFDAWIGDPEVRELVGLPKVSSMDVSARLLERDAVWTVQGATCKSPWFSLQFKKGGTAQLTVSESCKGKKGSKSTQATWKQTPAGPFQLELKKGIEGMTLPAKSTLVLDDSYQQLKLIPDGGGDPVGGAAFEPGAARLDDSTL